MQLTAPVLGQSCRGAANIITLPHTGSSLRSNRSSFTGINVPYQKTTAPQVHKQCPGARATLVPFNYLLGSIAGTAPYFAMRLTGFYILQELGVSKPWTRELTEDEKQRDLMKSTSKWKVVKNNMLQRKHRCRSVDDGKKKLRAVCDLLADDESFYAASTHKGCMIRRETAHSESLCCHNVRALFDENPFPHIIVEVTRFPEGRIGQEEYFKAEKLERCITPPRQ